MTDREISDEAPEINFQEKSKWKNRFEKAKKRFVQFLKAFNTVFGLLLISTVMIFPYPNPVTQLGSFDSQPYSSDTRTILVERSEGAEVFKNFDEKLEEGFCTFGTYNKTHIVIKEIDHVENPFVQTRVSISNMCIDEIKKRLPHLYTSLSYSFLGNIHTHPGGEAKPSMRDFHTMGKMFLFGEAWGVATENELNFYGEDSLAAPMTLKYYNDSQR